jgi:hypothetical protein
MLGLVYVDRNTRIRIVIVYTLYGINSRVSLGGPDIVCARKRILRERDPAVKSNSLHYCETLHHPIQYVVLLKTRRNGRISTIKSPFNRMRRLSFGYNWILLTVRHP